MKRRKTGWDEMRALPLWEGLEILIAYRQGTPPRCEGDRPRDLPEARHSLLESADVIECGTERPRKRPAAFYHQ